jgi:hypothetical protein
VRKRLVAPALAMMGDAGMVLVVVEVEVEVISSDGMAGRKLGAMMICLFVD